MFKAVLTIALLLSSMSSLASAEKQLREKLANYQGYKAQFSQQVVDNQGNQIHQASGHLGFAQPGKFYWNVELPDEEKLISDGVLVWWYNPFLEQVTIYDAKQALLTTPFALLVNSDDSVWSQYQIEQQQQRYTIKPDENQQSQVSALEVVFDGEHIKQLVIVDRTRQTSTYTLSKQQFNKLSESEFSFEIPQGVEVDDQSATVVSQGLNSNN